MSVVHQTSILARMDITDLLESNARTVEAPAIFDPITGKILVKAYTIESKSYRLDNGSKIYGEFSEIVESAEDLGLALFEDGNKVIVGLEILKFFADSTLDAYELSQELLLNAIDAAKRKFKLFGIKSSNVKIIVVSRVDC